MYDEGHYADDLQFIDVLLIDCDFQLPRERSTGCIEHFDRQSSKQCTVSVMLY